MYTPLQGTGPRATFAALTGGGQGIPMEPGVRQENRAEMQKPAPKVFDRTKLPPPPPAGIYLDPYHGDLGVCRQRQALHLAKVPQDIIIQIKRILAHHRDISTDKIQKIIDKALRGRTLPKTNILVQLIFGHHDVPPDASLDVRLQVMVKQSLDKLEAALYPKKDTRIEFPSEQL
jgi:hypothetical protein